MMKITLKNPGELDALLSSADYEKFVAEEGGTEGLPFADLPLPNEKSFCFQAKTDNGQSKVM